RVPCRDRGAYEDTRSPRGEAEGVRCRAQSPRGEKDRVCPAPAAGADPTARTRERRRTGTEARSRDRAREGRGSGVQQDKRRGRLLRRDAPAAGRAPGEAGRVPPAERGARVCHKRTCRSRGPGRETKNK